MALTRPLRGEGVEGLDCSLQLGGAGGAGPGGGPPRCSGAGAGAGRPRRQPLALDRLAGPQPAHGRSNLPANSNTVCWKYTFPSTLPESFLLVHFPSLFATQISNLKKWLAQQGPLLIFILNDCLTQPVLFRNSI